MENTDTIEAADSAVDAAAPCSPLYSYSYDEENYWGSFATREDAAAEAFAENETAQEVWTAEQETPARVVSAEYLIEQVADSTAGMAGDWADSYLQHVTKEACEDLQARLQALWDWWEEKYNEVPTWFNVTDPVKYSRSQVNVTPLPPQ